MEIHESIQKILGHQEIVADLFYQTFLGRHPEIRPYFEGVDMKRQAVLLTMTLMLIEHHFLHGYPATEKYLKLLGRQHHERRKIPAEAFVPFRVCMLDTLSQFHGAEWSDDLAAQWHQAIDRAAQTMLEGYAPDEDA